MRAIFLNRYFYPDHSATSQMLSGIAFGIAAQGLPVHIITSRLRYDSASVLAANEAIDGVEIHRLWTTRFGRSNLLGRAVDYCTFYLSSAYKLLRLARRGDVVIAKTDPPMLSLIAAPIARFKGAVSVNWLQDIFPEIARELGALRSPLAPLLYDTMCRLRNRSLRGSFNVVLGDQMAAQLEKKGVAGEKIRVIENFADGALIRPIPAAASQLRQELGLVGKFVVGYSGNLGRAHEYKTMLQAMEALQGGAMASRGLPVAWLFVGGGALYEPLKREVRSRNLSDVHFLPYQPETSLADSLAAADVHLVSLRPSLEGLILPSKFYGICAAGRPCLFIGHPAGEVAERLRRHRCGLTIPVGDGALLAKTIARLACRPWLCRAMGQRAYRAFKAQFDKPLAIDRWRALLEELSQQRRHPARRRAAEAAIPL